MSAEVFKQVAFCASRTLTHFVLMVGIQDARERSSRKVLQSDLKGLLFLLTGEFVFLKKPTTCCEYPTKKLEFLVGFSYAIFEEKNELNTFVHTQP